MPFVRLHLVEQPPNVVLHGVRNEPRLALHPEPDLGGKFGGDEKFGEAEVGDEFEAGVVHHDVDRASTAAFEDVSHLIDVVDEDEGLEGGQLLGGVTGGRVSRPCIAYE